MRNAITKLQKDDKEDIKVMANSCGALMDSRKKALLDDDSFGIKVKANGASKRPETSKEEQENRPEKMKEEANGLPGRNPKMTSHVNGGEIAAKRGIQQNVTPLASNNTLKDSRGVRTRQESSARAPEHVPMPVAPLNASRIHALPLSDPGGRSNPLPSTTALPNMNVGASGNDKIHTGVSQRRLTPEVRGDPMMFAGRQHPPGKGFSQQAIPNRLRDIHTGGNHPDHSMYPARDRGFPPQEFVPRNTRQLAPLEVRCLQLISLRDRKPQPPDSTLRRRAEIEDNRKTDAMRPSPPPVRGVRNEKAALSHPPLNANARTRDISRGNGREREKVDSGDRLATNHLLNRVKGKDLNRESVVHNDHGRDGPKVKSSSHRFA